MIVVVSLAQATSLDVSCAPLLTLFTLQVGAKGISVGLRARGTPPSVARYRHVTFPSHSAE
eukprot:4602192-Alexandrium_andersonii.AAC.1